MLGDPGQYGVPEYLTSNAGSEPLSDLMSVRSIRMPPEAVAGTTMPFDAYESLIQASRWFWIWWPITHALMP